MDIANELALYLQSAGFGTYGADIHVAQIPSGENGIYISRTGGSFNNYLPTEETVVDIYYKHTKSETCVTNLENIKRHIHRMHNTTTENAYIYSMLVLGDIENLERDAEYAKLYKITVSIMHRALSVIS